MNQEHILAGLTVLELGQVISGPFAGAILADMGAEVIKIERVDGGDDARTMGAAFRHGDSLNFHIFNRGKKSLALDLTSGEGKAAFERLGATADVVIHNLRPGVVQDLGVDGATLCARWPRLIYAEISAFGHTGPMHMRPGYEPMVQAFSGLSSTNGGPDDPPTRIGVSVCDQGAGMWSVIGILALLQRRHLTGRGGMVNASLLETALVWNGQKIDSFVNEGSVPQRHASGHPGFAPYEAFDTGDAPLLICCGNDRLFARLARVLDRPEWTNDPQFASNRARIVNREALTSQMRGLLRLYPRAHWLALFEAAGVPCAPIQGIAQALAEPQVQALALQQQVQGDDFPLTGLPLSFDGVRPQPRSAGPALGAHNSEFGL